MFDNFFKKKETIDVKEEKKEDVNPYSKPIEKKPTLEIKNELTISPSLEVKTDYITEQCTIIGKDIKEEVERICSGFFSSRNEKKSAAYHKFESFLLSYDADQAKKIQKLSYLEFKEKEYQVSTSLKNSFSQFLSKGAHIDEQSREVINFVFDDVKKLSSRAHRYWYYTIFIWKRPDTLV